LAAGRVATCVRRYLFVYLNPSEVLQLVCLIEFADPPPTQPTAVELPSVPLSSNVEEDIVPIKDPPTTLMEWAVLILNTAHPTLKVEGRFCRHFAN